jgi:hypothetical protein
MARFGLLEDHYSSDVKRLEALAEVAAVFETLHPGPCPLCGAAPEHHFHTADCEVDPKKMIAAAEAEISRIKQLQQGLADTRSRLAQDHETMTRRSGDIIKESETTDRRAADAFVELRNRRKGVGEIDAGARQLRMQLRNPDIVEELRSDLVRLQGSLNDAEESVPEVGKMDLPTAATTKFVGSLAQTLSAWGLPDCDPVQWNEKKTDIVVGPRQRADRGKGLRALTSAAFVLTLLRDCRADERPHSGFSFLDSPLLTYREPDKDEADLSSSDIDEKFYRWLVDQKLEWQVIVAENRPTPDWVEKSATVIKFTRNKHHGRFGFFPPL